MHNVVYILTLLLAASGTAVNFGNWLLCLFSCTFPAPLVPRGLNAAHLPPTPWVCPNLPFLFLSLRSSSVFDLCLVCLESRQPGQTQEVGLGSWICRPPLPPFSPSSFEMSHFRKESVDNKKSLECPAKNYFLGRKIIFF
jgi:hypothetical protein